MITGPEPQADDLKSLHPAPDAAGWLDEHGDALYRYARSRVGRRELAEDLVQETFLAALRAQFDGHCTVRTWLLAILRRKIIDHFRHAAAAWGQAVADAGRTGDPIRAGTFGVDGSFRRALADWRTPPAALEDRELWEVLDACLRRLPWGLAGAFVLRELEGLATDEVRRLLDLTPGSLRVRLHRARLLLRECLEENWFGADADRGAAGP